MGYIFISYSHQDKKYVHKLESDLKEKGFDVWVDVRINSGEQWPTAIQTKLDACDAFIIVISEESSKSDFVEKEIARATSSLSERARPLQKSPTSTHFSAKNWKVLPTLVRKTAQICKVG